jgi:hypothetical protein
VQAEATNANMAMPIFLALSLGNCAPLLKNGDTAMVQSFSKRAGLNSGNGSSRQTKNK